MAVTTYQRAIEIMQTTPAVLRALVTGLPAEALERAPAEGQWSVRDVLAHMVQAEAGTIGPRIQSMLDQPGAPLPRPNPVEVPATPRAMFDLWDAARQRNLELFRSVRPEQLDQTDQHARYGAVSLGEHVVEWAYHDLDHLRQMLAALQAELYPEIPTFHNLYPSPV